MTLALRQVHVGDCRALLAQMDDESVNCVVTSPPYWGLRSYLPGKVVLRRDLPPDVRDRVTKELAAKGVVPIEGSQP